jgi:Ca2+-binding EF-hand superfamily protein
LKEIELRKQLNLFDPTHSGAVKLSELQSILQMDDFKLPEDALARIFKAVVQLEMS